MLIDIFITLIFSTKHKHEQTKPEKEQTKSKQPPVKQSKHSRLKDICDYKVIEEIAHYSTHDNFVMYNVQEKFVLINLYAENKQFKEFIDMSEKYLSNQQVQIPLSTLLTLLLQANAKVFELSILRLMIKETSTKEHDLTFLSNLLCYVECKFRKYINEKFNFYYSMMIKKKENYTGLLSHLCFPGTAEKYSWIYLHKLITTKIQRMVQKLVDLTVTGKTIQDLNNISISLENYGAFAQRMYELCKPITFNDEFYELLSFHGIIWNNDN